MAMLDFDNIPIRNNIRDINTNTTYKILSSHIDLDDAIQGRRSEVVTVEKMNTKEQYYIYSTCKVSTVYEIIEDFRNANIS